MTPFYVFIFLLGSLLGSFVNVVVFRLRNGGDMIFGRSACPNCRTILKWFDLIPILSFFFLWGRCRKCCKKISWQYPIVEFLSGLIWVGVFWKILGDLEFGVWPWGFQIFQYIYYVFIFSSLLAIAVYDFNWKIIPDKIVLPAIVSALATNAIFSFWFRDFFGNFLVPLGIATAIFFLFYAIYFFSRGKAIGFGDVKLGFCLGLFLTPLQAYLMLNLAFIVGGLFGIIMIIAGKKSIKSQIAFGPFLSLSSFLVFLFDFMVARAFPF